MATTLEIVVAIKGRLAAKLPGLAVEYFPDRPDEYRLNHPKGALLVSYLGSRFGDVADIEIVAQERTAKFSVTVLLRQLNGNGGAIDVLDQVRLAVAGFRPPDCRKVWIVGERYLGESTGIWQYAVDFATETMLVEDADVGLEPLLTNVDYEENP